jgi:hypothetical protein
MKAIEGLVYFYITQNPLKATREIHNQLHFTCFK